MGSYKTMPEMRKRVPMIQFLLVAALVAIGPFDEAEAAVRQTQVRTSRAQICSSYLHVPHAGFSFPLVLEAQASGIKSFDVADRLLPSSKKIYRESRAAVLAFNKPGVMAVAYEKTGYRVDKILHGKYTQDDLVECALNSLVWALREKEVADGASIIFRGDGEGAQILARVYLKLVKEKSPLLERIKGVFLSDTPMGSWRDALKALRTQTKYPKFWEAIDWGNPHLQSGEDRLFLKKNGYPSGVIYLQQVFKFGSLSAYMKKILEDYEVPSRFHLFESIRGPHVREVSSFQKWNHNRLEADEFGMDLKIDYFNSGRDEKIKAIDKIYSNMVESLNSR
jgi:hypothetical protein